MCLYPVVSVHPQSPSVREESPRTIMFSAASRLVERSSYTHGQSNAVRDCYHQVGTAVWPRELNTGLDRRILEEKQQRFTQ